MKTFLYLIAATALFGLAGCSMERFSQIPSYKLKVIQGNELDAQALANLHTGMSREQVQMLLGTPLLRDPFHSNRWDYVFVVSRNGIVKENKSLILFFGADGNLTRIEGDVIPVSAPQPAAGTSATTATTKS